MDAAWAGAIGAVVGALVTQGFNIWLDARRVEAQRVERERDRTHDRDLRKLELDEAHRARLYNDRKAAYADFYRSYHAYQRAYEDRLSASGHAVLEEGNADLEAFGELMVGLFDTRRALDESLRFIELAASPAVRDAASELRKLVHDVEEQELNSDLKGMDEAAFHSFLAKVDSAYAAVGDGEKRLREAIQVELELGR